MADFQLRKNPETGQVYSLDPDKNEWVEVQARRNHKTGHVFVWKPGDSDWLDIGQYESDVEKTGGLGDVDLSQSMGPPPALSAPRTAPALPVPTPPATGPVSAPGMGPSMMGAPAMEAAPTFTPDVPASMPDLLRMMAPAGLDALPSVSMTPEQAILNPDRRPHSRSINRTWAGREPFDIDRQREAFEAMTGSPLLDMMAPPPATAAPVSRETPASASPNRPEWLSRALDPSTPTLIDADGEHTILTESVEVDGKHFLYPTVRMIDGKLVRLDSDTAFDMAMEKGDYLTFPNERAATGTSKSISESVYEARRGAAPEIDAKLAPLLEIMQGVRRDLQPLDRPAAPKPPAPPPVNKPGTVASRTLTATGQALQNVPENLLTGWYGLKQADAELGAENLKQIPAIEQQMADLKKRIDTEPNAPAILNAQYEELSQHRDRLRLATGVTQDTFDERTRILDDFQSAGDAARAKIKENEASRVEIDAEPGSPEYYVALAIGSSAEMAPALAISAIMRNPAPSMAFMGGYSGGSAYSQGREEGLSPREAKGYSLLYAMSEGIPEALPVSVLIKPGTKFLTRIVSGAAAEGAQEMLTEALQIGIDEGYLDKNMTWAEARSRLIDAGIIGSIAGGTLATGVNTAEAGLNLLNRDREKQVAPPEDRGPTPPNAGVPPLEGEAAANVKTPGTEDAQSVRDTIAPTAQPAAPQAPAPTDELLATMMPPAPPQAAPPSPVAETQPVSQPAPPSEPVESQRQPADGVSGDGEAVPADGGGRAGAFDPAQWTAMPGIVNGEETGRTFYENKETGEVLNAEQFAQRAAAPAQDIREKPADTTAEPATPAAPAPAPAQEPADAGPPGQPVTEQVDAQVADTPAEPENGEFARPNVVINYVGKDGLTDAERGGPDPTSQRSRWDAMSPDERRALLKRMPGTTKKDGTLNKTGERAVSKGWGDLTDGARTKIGERWNALDDKTPDNSDLVADGPSQPEAAFEATPENFPFSDSEAGNAGPQARRWLEAASDETLMAAPNMGLSENWLQAERKRRKIGDYAEPSVNETTKPVAPEDRPMSRAGEVWDAMTTQEREAFLREQNPKGDADVRAKFAAKPWSDLSDTVRAGVTKKLPDSAFAAPEPVQQRTEEPDQEPVKNAPDAETVAEAAAADREAWSSRLEDGFKLIAPGEPTANGEGMPIDKWMVETPGLFSAGTGDSPQEAVEQYFEWRDADDDATSEKSPGAPELTAEDANERPQDVRVDDKAGREDLERMVKAGATPDQIEAHPAFVAAMNALLDRARNATNNQAGYDSVVWHRDRVYIFDGERVQGTEQALPRWIETAHEYAGPEGPAHDKLLTIILGPSAAGKSTIAESLATSKRSAILDSDDIKKTLPEFDGGLGAAAVHEESSDLANAVERELRARGTNAIYPKVGGNPESIRRMVERFKADGYKVEIINMAVEPDEAYRRMVLRFIATGRIIDPNYVRETGDKPSTTYRTLQKESIADGYAEIDNNGEMGARKPVRDISGQNPLAGTDFDDAPGREQAVQREPGVEGDQRPSPSQGRDQASEELDGAPTVNLGRRLAEVIGRGEPPKSNAALMKMAAEEFGGTIAEGAFSPKDAYEALELAMNLHLRRGNARGELFDPGAEIGSAKATANILQELVETLPTQTRRDTETDAFQQFSTPPAYGYAVNWVANIQNGDRVLEPSAGNGGIAVFAQNAGATVDVNELSDRRVPSLKALDFNRVTTEDAEQIGNIWAGDKSRAYDVVVMNPPFSAAGSRGTKNTSATGANHIKAALALLKPGGRLVAIMGHTFQPRNSRVSKFFAGLDGKATLQANIVVKGDQVYKKYGTTYDNRLLVIDKTPAAQGHEALEGTADSIPDLIDLLKDIRDAAPERSRETETASPDAEQRPGKAGGSSATDGGSSGRGSGKPEQRAEPDDLGRTDERPGRAERSGERDSDDGGATRAESDGAQGGVNRGSRKRDGRDGAAGSGGRSSKRAGGDTLKLKEASESQVEETGHGFAKYRATRVRIEGAKPHPMALVESSAMAAVNPPLPNYEVHLPAKMVKDGLLSEAQLEQVVYAGAAHAEMLPAKKEGEAQRRKGYYIGDGTGLGKTREIAGIIADNWAQGRKRHILVSKNKNLFKDAKKQFEGLGMGSVPMADLGATKADGTVPKKDGIMFATYDTLKNRGKTKTRMEQLIEWVGPEFDGTIIFDEAHKAGNALRIKKTRGYSEPSKSALAVIDLQNALPNARIVYASATAATEVHNFAYADRLGIWGPGTPFPTVESFVGQVVKGGIAAMEVVARDLKQMGVYMARNLSYEGVEYAKVEHTLTKPQREMYDTAAEAWQIVMQNMEKVISEMTEGGGMQRGAARGQFWSAHQRFFNQVLTAMQMPTVLSEMEKDLNKGLAPVVQLVNTNEAGVKRALERMADGDTLDDIDITPRDQLMGFLENTFPVQQYEDYTDGHGNVRQRPVVDSKGNPVLNADAVAVRDELMAKLSALTLPGNPLDMIIEKFGVDAVAEVTGRTKRIVTVNGKKKLEKHSQIKARAQAQEFMAGKRKILVFSEAGGTGASYHASNTVKNKARRAHYVVQAGWRADSAIQGFGRTHRTNQAQPPIYKLAGTDLSGHKRFTSSIARRLDQLGALTKGQKDSGGGMFDATDNLENDFADIAVETLFKEIRANKVEGFSAQELAAEMGIRVQNDQGGFKMPPNFGAKDFLNRILNTRIDVQNMLFDRFVEHMENAVQYAIDTGQFTAGVEEVKHDGAVLVDTKEAYRDESTGATSEYRSITLTKRVFNVSFEDFSKNWKNITWKKHKETGTVYGFRSASQATSATTGEVVPTYHRYSPTDRTIIESTDYRFKYEIIQADEAEIGWNEQIENAPLEREETLHLVTGALLPIWDRLPTTSPKIVRLKLDDGRSLLGRTIPDIELTRTLENLGVTGSEIDMSAAEIQAAVLQQNKTVLLSSGHKLVRRRVGGEQRIEVMSPPAQAYDDSKPGGTLQRLGFQIERINYKARAFLATGEKGVPALDGFMKGKRIVNVTMERDQVGTKPISTTTAAFKKWFGDSKVVDENGDPLVVYHGTRAKFDAFSAVPYGARVTGDEDAIKAFFFSASPSVAKTYSDSDGLVDKVRFAAGMDKPRVEAVYLAAQNPYIFDARGGDYSSQVFSDVIDTAKENGHDGVIIKNVKDDGFSGVGEVSDVYAVFRPTQIKSVYNRGTWDASDSRILFQNAPTGEAFTKWAGTDAPVIDFSDLIWGKEDGDNVVFENEGNLAAELATLVGDSLPKTPHMEVDFGASNVSASHYVNVDFFEVDEDGDASDQFGGFKLRFSDHADRYGSNKTIRYDDVSQPRYEDGDYVETAIDKTALSELVAEGRAAILDAFRSEADGVLSQAEIKSVNNRGTFDPTDPRIVYREGQPTDYGPALDIPLVNSLRSELKRLGLPDVDLRFDPKMAHQGTIYADHFGKVLITIGNTLNPKATLGHEAIHAYKHMGVFTEAEWSVLSETAETEWIERYDIETRYPDLIRAEQIEEAVAEAFGEAYGTKVPPAPGPIRAAFKKIANFLKAVQNWAKGHGMQTSADIIDALARGEFKKRKRPAGWTTQTERLMQQRQKPRQKGSMHLPDRYVWDSLIHTNGGIRARVKAVKGALGDRFDKARFNVQDRLLPVLRAQQLVERQMGAPMPEELNVYLAEEMYSGRAGHKLDQIDLDYTTKIIEIIGKTKGMTVETVGDYLYARHAQERNERIAQINPDMQDGGSGMDTQDAADRLDAIENSAEGDAYKDIGKLVDRLRKWGIDERVKHGLMTKYEADAWRNAYKSYVPLKGWAETDGSDAELDITGVGRGYNVRGPESKMAFGRSTEAFNPLLAAISQAQEVAIRSEKNRVGQHLYQLAKDVPAKNLWEIKKTETKRVFNETTGLVEERSVAPISLLQASNEIAVKVDGVEHRVILHDPRLADAITAVGTDNLLAGLRWLSKFSRYFSAINTMLNPVFVVKNFVRDTVTANINIQSREKAGKIQRGMMKDLPKALAGAYRGMGGKSDTAWSKYYQEYSESGGKVSFWVMETPESSKKKLDQRLRREANGLKGMSLALVTPSTDLNPVLGAIERINLAVDNAIRLSAFVHARKNGYSTQEAASLAKNLTVNFNRRGKYGSLINAAYTFSNAGLQGTHIMFKALKSHKVKAIVGGLAVIGYMLDQANTYLSDEDEDGQLYYDKMRDYLHAQHLMIMLGGKDKAADALSIWLPYGYNVFPLFGNLVSRVQRGQVDADDAMQEMAVSVFQSFSPIAERTLMGTITPTIADPLREVNANQNFLGWAIHPFWESNLPNAMRPGDASQVSAIAAAKLNAWTGGNVVESGWADVFPEDIDHIASFLTGGMGRTFGQSVDVFAKLANDSPVEVEDVPLAKDVYRRITEKETRSLYFDRGAMIQDAAADAKDLKAAGLPVPHHIQWRAELNSIRLQAERLRKGTKKVTQDVDKAYLTLNSAYVAAWKRNTPYSSDSIFD